MDPVQWETDGEYQRLERFLKELKVVNDVAEGCVKDVQEYKDMAGTQNTVIVYY